MKRKTRESIPDRLAAAHAAITNALGDTVLQSQLSRSGLDATALNEGKTLLDEATATAVLEACALGVLKQSETYLERARADAVEAFSTLVRVLKAALKNDISISKALRLDRAIPLETGRFISAAFRLFDRLAGDPELRKLLARTGFDAPRLRAGRAKIVCYENATNGVRVAKVAARHSVEVRVAAVAKLDSYMSKFRKAALQSVEEDRFGKLGLRTGRKTAMGKQKGRQYSGPPRKKRN